MKKLLLTATALAALSLLAPNFSYADDPVTDPTGAGYLGVYLNDGTGEMVSCVSGVSTAVHQLGWIVWLSPHKTAMRGFECGLDLTLPTKDSQITSFVSITYPVSAIDVGANDLAAGTYNYIPGYQAPITTGLATVVADIDIFFLEAPGVQIDISLRNAIPPSVDGLTLPMVMDDNFNLHAVNMVQDGDLVAQINAPACTVVLDSEDVSWGAVKSLFR